MSLATTSTVTVKSEDVWFDDGDLVLQTDDAHFRVHSLLMIKFSSVLEGILRATLASKSFEKIDGCPAVRLHDKGSDLRTLLHALYTPSSRLHAKSSTDVLEVATLLNLSAKYNCTRLHTSALHVLSRQFPSTLERWDKRKYNVHFERHVFEVADAAREARAWTLLPTVLLHCCLRQSANAMIGFAPAQCYVPSEENAKAVKSAQQYLASEIHRDVFPTFYAPDTLPELCYTPHHCVRAKAKLAKWMSASTFCWCYRAPTFDGWLKTWGFCQQCQRTYGQQYRDGRTEVWKTLPRLFGLGTWEALREREVEEEQARKAESESDTASVSSTETRADADAVIKHAAKADLVL